MTNGRKVFGEFLVDAKHELSEEDAERAARAYSPYGSDQGSNQPAPDSARKMRSRCGSGHMRLSTRFAIFVPLCVTNFF